MELILLKDTHNRAISQLTSLLLQRAGYVFLDPDHYLIHSPYDDDACFQSLYRAKQWCLVNAFASVQNGQPVVLNGDFINDSDLLTFTRLGCRIETLNTNDIGSWLRSKQCMTAMVNWPRCAGQ